MSAPRRPDHPNPLEASLSESLHTREDGRASVLRFAPPDSRSSLSKRDPSETHYVYTGYLILLSKRDQAFRERGELDPQTWLAIREQVLEDPDLHIGQKGVLVSHIDNVMRHAGGEQP